MRWGQHGDLAEVHAARARCPSTPPRDDCALGPVPATRWAQRSLDNLLEGLRGVLAKGHVGGDLAQDLLR